MRSPESLVLRYPVSKRGSQSLTDITTGLMQQERSHGFYYEHTYLLGRHMRLDGVDGIQGAKKPGTPETDRDAQRRRNIGGGDSTGTRAVCVCRHGVGAVSGQSYPGRDQGPQAGIV